jgi:hypothetical protein
VPKPDISTRPFRSAGFSPQYRGLQSAFLRFLLIFSLVPFLTAWDLPFLSNRQRGDNDFKAERYPEAIEHFQRAIETEGNDWRLLYDLGTSYYHQGEWQHAVEELTYSSQIAETENAPDLDRAHVLHNLGLAYLQLDDCENAVPNLEKAAQLAPNDQDVSRNFDFAKQYCSNQQGNQNSDQQQNQSQSDQQNQSQSQDQQSQDQQSQDQQNQDQQNQDEQDQQDQQNQDQQNQQNQQNQDQQNQDQQNQQNQDQQDQQNQDQQNQDQQQDSGNASEQNSPNPIPNDGLNLTDQQVQQILDYMSQQEQNRAQRYFQNGPAEGDYLDDESMADLIRRLFLGIPDENRRQPSDGIDW